MGVCASKLCSAAHAKVNLYLEITGRRADGYHDLCMVNQLLSLADRLTLTPGTSGRITLTCDNPLIPTDERNLVWQAAVLFLRTAKKAVPAAGLHFSLEKSIPSQAGLGGGSADAAAALRLLNLRFEEPLTDQALFALASELGADVPFALLGGTARVFGKGEVLEPLPLWTGGCFLLAKPKTGISTKAAFQAYDSADTPPPAGDFEGLCAALRQSDPSAVGRLLFNQFEALAPLPEIALLHRALLDCGALGAALSGSGSTVFGLFQTPADAENARQKLAGQVDFLAVARPCAGGMAALF